MPIRNSAKAIIIKDGCILLNQCTSPMGSYYALPGGGQNHGETLEEAIVREIHEETGRAARPVRMCGVYEQITPGRGEGTDHKVYFLFQCELENDEVAAPTERDRYQLGTQWVPLKILSTTKLFPQTIRDNVEKMLASENTLFLGSERKK